ncbi:MAG: 50S ribosomal protein L17 [Coriobacteriales bacterium]|nr:50S ribosomal protein L17 [Coriobacteriales bacterium]
MRHYKRGRKLGTDASHTKAMKKSLTNGLFANDRIKTTLERAKEIRGDVDRVITWAKRGDVHARRLAIAALGDKALVGEIFAKVEQGLFSGREGGYTRILRLGTRRGDGATIVIMELVQEPVKPKKERDAAAAVGNAAGKGTTAKGAAAGKTKAKSKTSKAKAPVVEKIEEAYDKAEAEADGIEDEAAVEAEVAAEVEEASVEDEAPSADAAEGEPVAEEDSEDEAPAAAEVEVEAEAGAEEAPAEDEPSETEKVDAEDSDSAEDAKDSQKEEDSKEEKSE